MYGDSIYGSGYYGGITSYILTISISESLTQTEIIKISIKANIDESLSSSDSIKIPFSLNISEDISQSDDLVFKITFDISEQDIQTENQKTNTKRIFSDTQSQTEEFLVSDFILKNVEYESQTESLILDYVSYGADAHIRVRLPTTSSLRQVPGVYTSAVYNPPPHYQTYDGIAGDTYDNASYFYDASYLAVSNSVRVKISNASSSINIVNSI